MTVPHHTRPPEGMNHIGGLFVAPRAGGVVELKNPSTGLAFGEAADSTAADIDAAVEVATVAFERWAGTTPQERSEALLAWADALESVAEDLAQAEAENAGKPISAVRSLEIPAGIDTLRFYAGAGRLLEGRAATEYTAGATSMIRREPVGVVGQIAPWNYPFTTMCAKVGAALAAGCTTVFKPAPTTPRTALLAAAASAGILPDGALNVVTGDREPGQSLVTHPGVALVAVTGSIDTGRWVAANAAPTLKRTHLELGGNAPVLIFDDVELESALDGVAFYAFYNAGQDCTAATRILAHQSIVADVVEGLARRAEALQVGDALDSSTELGPVNSARHRDRIAGFFARLPEHARVVTGGAVLDREGWFIPPTVVTGLATGDEIVRDEVFGPVVTVQSFADEDDAVRMAHSTRFGLGASVWTNDLGRAMRLAGTLRFGTVWVNDHGLLLSEMPHGGFGDSGYGKDLSAYGLDEYTDTKHVMVRWA